MRELVWNAEIGASLAPFTAMRLDAAASGTMIGDEVGQLMAQGAFDLAFKGEQAWI